MIKAVIDTNVFLSAIFWEGTPKQVIELALSKKIIGVTSKQILEELEEKLLKKFGFPEDQTGAYLTLLVENFSVVEPARKVSIVREDPDDNKIIEAAIEAKADCIVTGDKHLLKIGAYSGIEIIKPHSLLKKIIPRP